MSTVLPQPSFSDSARAAAAGEVALILGRLWDARKLAGEALAADPGCARALALYAKLDRWHAASSARTVDRPPGRIPSNVAESYRSRVDPSLSHAEATAAVAAIMAHGRRRPRASRRHRGEPLRPGSLIVVHHSRPDVAIVMRNGRATGLRLRGRTVTVPRWVA